MYFYLSQLPPLTCPHYFSYIGGKKYILSATMLSHLEAGKENVYKSTKMHINMMILYQVISWNLYHSVTYYR
jgi:hypothetical protein